MASAQRGFTYLAVLFLVALTAAALAALGQAWSTAAQREKERELEFRGREIARAIASYVKAGIAGPGSPGGAYPRSLDELLIDRRGTTPHHHLRRRYADPFTGQPDWVLIEAPGDSQRFHGVRSRSDQQLLRRLGPDGISIERAEDWEFLAQADTHRPREAATDGANSSVQPLPPLPALPVTGASQAH